MKRKIEKLGGLAHVESGIYEVVIVEKLIRQPEAGPQLQLKLEVISKGRFQHSCFLHCIMLDGSASFYEERVVNAARISKSRDGEYDDDDLIGRCIMVKLENSPWLDSSGRSHSNYYPRILDMWPCAENVADTFHGEGGAL